MKYDEQIFNLSSDAYNMIKSFNANNDEEIKIKQDKVLKLLMKKFQEQLKSKTNLEEGILKVKFKNKFFSDYNDGYHEIEELVKENNFDSFASEYCMYLGNVEYRCDECNTAYYEVIWDYKTYFEQLNTPQNRKK